MPAESKRRTVQLTLAGRQYKIVTTASDADLARLAGRVERRLKDVAGSRGATPEAILLTAMALAHDVEQESARADRVLEKAKRAATELLERVDAVLGEDVAGQAEKP